MNEKKLLREKGKHLKPTVWLGKNGLTQTQLDEINKQLKKRRLIKVKILKSLRENIKRKELAAEIAEKTNSTLIDVVGSMVVLKKD